MKNFEAERGIGMTESQARRFLKQSRSTLLLGTTDADRTPVIHPVWYYFDSTKTKLYFYTEPALKKATNIKERSRIYFDVDSDRWPYKGVKGKGEARIIADKKESLSYGRKILTKYVKKGRPFFKSVLEKMKSGGYVVFEITPAYFTSWDYGKTDPQTSKALRDSIIS